MRNRFPILGSDASYLTVFSPPSPFVAFLSTLMSVKELFSYAGDPPGTGGSSFIKYVSATPFRLLTHPHFPLRGFLSFSFFSNLKAFLLDGPGRTVLE